MPVDPHQVVKSFSIMGSSFITGAGSRIDALKPGQAIELRRQPNNPAHSNAIALLVGGQGLGFLPRQLADEIAPLMDLGIPVIARKAAPLPRFGAYRGILELAYIPPTPAESPDKAAATGTTGEAPDADK